MDSSFNFPEKVRLVDRAHASIIIDCAHPRS